MSNHEAREIAIGIANQTLSCATSAYDVDTGKAIVNEYGKPMYAFPCKEEPEIFFGEGHSAATLAAKMICDRCFVKDACLEEGFKPINLKPGTGIYGGLTPQQRVTARRKGNVA